jgi:tetratricopeptide (TPR) repeat protein
MGARALALILVTAGLSGCASPRLSSARKDFYKGDLASATATLQNAPSADTDQALLLMERGMVKHASGRYKASAADWLEAAETIGRLDKVSVSRQTASFVTSDRVKTFRGLPYERTLLHAFSALNYFAMALWDDAAVEARNVIDRLENLNGFPDDAYSRYLAAFCLELIGNADGARRQYEAADSLTATLAITSTGTIIPSTEGKATDAQNHARSEGPELLCFISVGRGPDGHGRVRGQGRWGSTPFVEVYAKNELLGRSYALGSTGMLYNRTQDKLAAVRAAKEISRVVIKESLAASVADDHPALGMLLWIAMFAFEGQAERRWETLPLSLQVARVKCPDDLRRIKLVYRGHNGSIQDQEIFSSPLTRRRNTFVTFARSSPP